MMSGYGEIDSWTVERDGVRYRIDIDPDYEANADPAGQGDTYSPEDLAAHAAGLWRFTGVTVSPVITGADPELFSASLWSVEFGTMPAETEPHEGGRHEEVVIDRSYIEGYPFPDLAAEVRERLATFRTALEGLQLDDCPATHVRTEGIPQPYTVHCERTAGHEMPHRVMAYEWETPAQPAPRTKAEQIQDTFTAEANRFS
jgi:hypothetical protein